MEDQSNQSSSSPLLKRKGLTLQGTPRDGRSKEAEDVKDSSKNDHLVSPKPNQPLQRVASHERVNDVSEENIPPGSPGTRLRNDFRLMLRIKVLFESVKMSVTKVVILDPTITVSQAILNLSQKTTLTRSSSSETISTAIGNTAPPSEEDLKEYGIFLSAHQGALSGWLDEARTLDSYSLNPNLDVLEFRRKVRTFTVLCADGSKTVAYFEKDSTVRSILPSVVNKIGRDNVFDFEKVDKKQVVEVTGKSGTLMDMLFPETSEFMVMYHPLFGGSRESSIVEVFERDCFLCLRPPSKEGYLLKKSEFGVYKTWKKRYFVLRKDKLFLYKTEETKDLINFIPVQFVEQVTKNNHPDDGTSKKNFSFLIYTKHRIYLLAMPGSDNTSAEEGRHWLETLSSWLRFSKLFGPTNNSSIRKLETKDGPISIRKKTTLPPERRDQFANSETSAKGETKIEETKIEETKIEETKLEETTSEPLEENNVEDNTVVEEEPKTETQEEISTSLPPQKEQEIEVPVTQVPENTDQEKERSTSFASETIESNDGETAREVQFLMRNGTLKKVLLDTTIDVYDLVYALMDEIGSSIAHFMTIADQGSDREVELLDHQLPLKDQRLPQGAILVVKKTGIVTETIGPNDLYDNHFIFVQLPKFNKYVLRLGREVQKVWMLFRGRKITLFANEKMVKPLMVINLGKIASIRASHSGPLAIASILGPKTPTQCTNCGFSISIRSPQRKLEFCAESPEVRNQWIQLLESWRKFFGRDETREKEEKEEEGPPLSDILSFFS